jgi:hypothetical protein
VPESLEGLSEIQKIRHELEDIKSMTGALLHAQPNVAKGILDRLRKDAALREAFLLVDGQRSQGQIQSELAGTGIKGSSLTGISERFDILANDLGLVVLDRVNKEGKIYRRTPLDAALKISRTLLRERRNGR